MNSAHESLYQLHVLESARLGKVPLPYRRFCNRLRGASGHEELSLPTSAVHIRIQNDDTPLPLPQLRLTENVAERIPADELVKAVNRHAAGDWGMLNPTDWNENDAALRSGRPLLSVYRASNGGKFEIKTSPDRRLTTVSLLEDR